MFARVNGNILILLLLEMSHASLQENNSLLFRGDQRIFDQPLSLTSLSRSGDSEKFTPFLQSSGIEEEQYIAEQTRWLAEKCDSILRGCTGLLIPDDLYGSDMTMTRFSNVTEFYLEQRHYWNEFLQELQGNLSNILFTYDSRLRKKVSEIQIIKFSLVSFSAMCQMRTNIGVHPTFFPKRKELSNYLTISNPDIAKGVFKSLEPFLIKNETNFLDAQNSVKILQNFYNNKIYYEIDFLLRNHCFNEEILSEFLENEEKVNKLSLNIISLCRRVVIFHDVVEPILFVFLFVGNMVGNGTLLLIFARHKEVRTSNNIMIFNLAINDVLSVTIGVPLSYMISFYPQYNVNDNGNFNLYAQISTSIQFLFFMISAMSILVLSVQRYLATARPFFMSNSYISNRTVTIIYILSVWAFALIMYGNLLYQRIISNLNAGSEDTVNRYAFGISVLIFIFVPIIVSVLNILVSRRLKQSLRKLPEEGNFQALHKMRNRGSKVSIFLAIAFVVSFFPPILLSVLILTLPNLRENLANLFAMGRMIGYLFYISVLIYPLALYLSSNTYKSLYNKYLFRCCKSDKVPNVVVKERPPHNNETCL